MTLWQGCIPCLFLCHYFKIHPSIKNIDMAILWYLSIDAQSHRKEITIQLDIYYHYGDGGETEIALLLQTQLCGGKAGTDCLFHKSSLHKLSNTSSISPLSQ